MGKAEALRRWRHTNRRRRTRASGRWAAARQCRSAPPSGRAGSARGGVPRRHRRSTEELPSSEGPDPGRQRLLSRVRLDEITSRQRIRTWALRSIAGARRRPGTLTTPGTRSGARLLDLSRNPRLVLRDLGGRGGPGSRGLVVVPAVSAAAAPITAGRRIRWRRPMKPPRRIARRWNVPSGEGSYGRMSAPPTDGD